MTTLRANYLHPEVFTVPGFLDVAECESLIADSEATSYEEATVSTGFGGVMAKNVRNNDRVISDDAAMAARLWDRLRGVVPDIYLDEFRSIGLNERFRFYRYGPGQKFEWHRDGSFVRTHREQSLLTFMVYLNEACEGGETSFRSLPRQGDGKDWPTEVSVRPATGTALIFHHPVWHKGEEVRTGVKYVLRSDVMFERMPPLAFPEDAA